MDDYLLSLEDTILYVRTFFLVASLTLVISNIFPAMEYYMAYGSRALPANDTEGMKDETKPASQTSKMPLARLLTRLLDCTLAHPIPHSWFHHYYILSVSTSLFWGYQILTQGTFLRALSGRPFSATGRPSMSINQVILVWSLMILQGSRRLYESIGQGKNSTSRMQLSHWLVGMIYYFAVGISVWIEGSAAIQSQKTALDGLKVYPPSGRTIVFFPLFIFASGVQYDCHAYLASLKKYTLPVHPNFSRIICPHYTAECLIYVALMFLAAPQGDIINKTFLTILIFVVTNLSISAEANRKWYARKFGPETIAGRWRLLPYVY